MNIIITAFSAFGGLTNNSSEEVLKLLSNQYHKVVLPVSYQRAPRLLEELVLSNQPDALICLGQAGSSSNIRLEQMAYNEANALVPDEDQVTLTHHVLVNEGQSDLRTLFPIKEWVHNLQLEHHPLEVSCNPGRYVCNATYYRALSIIPNTIFIHLPYYKGQVENNSTLPLPIMVATIEAIMEKVKHHPF